MKTYLLILIGVWIISCGNSTPQSSNNNLLDAVAQDTVVQDSSAKKTKDTLDAILRACSEQAYLIYEKDYRPNLRNLAIVDYDDEFIAFFDTMEKIYQPYKERLMATITESPTEDVAFSLDFQVEFARDMLCLHTSYFLHGYYTGGWVEYNFGKKYRYVQFRKLIDKYYNILLEIANSKTRKWVPIVHKQWLHLLENDLKMSAHLDEYRWITLENIFDMMEQRLIFYYYCIQSNTPDDFN